MELDQICEHIRAFYLESPPNAGQPLTDTTNLLEDWFLDSMGVIETVVFLENAFEVDIHRADINADNFCSILALAHFVKAKLG